MRPLIAAQILIVSESLLQHHFIDESEDGRLRKLTGAYAAVILELAIDRGSRESWVGVLEITDLFLEIMIDLTAGATVTTAFGDKGIKSTFTVIEEPGFHGPGGISSHLAAGMKDAFLRKITKICAQRRIFIGQP